jgi:hypothetical protein
VRVGRQCAGVVFTVAARHSGQCFGHSGGILRLFQGLFRLSGGILLSAHRAVLFYKFSIRGFYFYSGFTFSPLGLFGLKPDLFLFLGFFFLFFCLPAFTSSLISEKWK